VAVCYLEVDDEITSAIARIRGIKDGEAIVVVPSSSRIATSRINFKLLVREGNERRLNMVAVSDEPQVRALAISAGLPAYDSIASAEQALATFREQDRRLAERLNPTETRVTPAPRGVPRSSDERVPSTSVMSSPTAAAASAAIASEAAAAPTVRAERRRRRAPVAPLLVIALFVILLGGIAYGAYVLLPTATITVRPLATQIRTPAFSVTADPTVAVADAASGLIPAQQITLPLHVSGQFPATGIDVHDIRAAGTVRFHSENTLNAVPIPADTVVSTADGVDFATQQDVTIPKASFATGPTQLDVAVRAVKGGIKGNVDAGAIKVVPPALAAQLVSVTNPDATSGGKHVEDQMISQADYDAATASLSGQLQATLATSLADPQSVPRGLTVFAQTAQLGTTHPDQPASSLVGAVVPTFALALDATAQLTAVNEALIDDVAADRLRALLQPGQRLVSDDISATIDAGTVVGNTIVFNVVANGLGYLAPDPQALVAAVHGKSVADARKALAPYGSADISVWPDFVDHLPDQTARINVTVIAPSPPASAAATPSPLRTPLPTPFPTTSPSASPSRSPSGPPAS
jgi:hypothetical protein